MKEERIGIITHYYTHLEVAAVVMEGELAVGDTIHIKGHTSNFIQKVESMQIEHKNVNHVKKGDYVGIKVKEHAREHDEVYKIMEE